MDSWLVSIPHGQADDIREGGYQYINPLLDCHDTPDLRIGYVKTLKSSTKGLIENYSAEGDITDVSVYFRALNDGPWFGINEDKTYTAASLVKVPIMMNAFALEQKVQGILKKKIKVKKRHLRSDDQSLKPDQKIQLDKKYTMENLVERMIIDSDNIAMEVLFDYISGLVKKVRLSKNPDGIQYLTMDADKISTKSYSAYFRVLFNATFLTRDLSEKALKILSRSSYSDGLTAGVSKGVPVAHKFGEWQIRETTQLHDCGIIYYPNHPYILFVLTRGTNRLKQEKLIADISRLIFTEIEHLYH